MLDVCVHISNIHMIYHNIISQTNTTCNTKSYKDDVQKFKTVLTSVVQLGYEKRRSESMLVEIRGLKQ